METFSALLAICAGNSSVSGDSPCVVVASLYLGTDVAKFIDVARFINVAKSTVQLDLITGVSKIINGERATVDNFRDAQRCAQFFMDIMKS